MHESPSPFHRRFDICMSSSIEEQASTAFPECCAGLWPLFPLAGTRSYATLNSATLMCKEGGTSSCHLLRVVSVVNVNHNDGFALLVRVPSNPSKSCSERKGRGGIGDALSYLYFKAGSPRSIHPPTLVASPRVVLFPVY